MAFRVERIGDQKAALRRICQLIADGSISPPVRRVALLLTRECKGRDDLCELHAIYDGLKNGTETVPGLSRGFRYVADPQAVDFFTSAPKSLALCEEGACGGDCDDATILIGALCASLGYTVGARAYGGSTDDGYTHIYPVVAVPKRGPWPKGYTGHPMDITVEDAEVGWEPKKGHKLTYWVG